MLDWIRRIAPWLVLITAHAAPAAAAPPHPCEQDRFSDECARSCVARPNQEVCNQLCTNFDGVLWCRAHCQADPDLSCMPSYSLRVEPCPAFVGSMHRFAGRALLGGQVRDVASGSFGVALLIGERFASEWSVIAKLSVLPLGLDLHGRYVLSGSLEAGIERMYFDLPFEDLALAFSASAGVWELNHCRADRCSKLAPLLSVGADLLSFPLAANAAYRPYQAWSFGLVSGVGYDPLLGRVIVRADASLGLELTSF